MSDLISKQAAVELAMKYCPDDDGTVQCDGDIRGLIDELENLPPAQPEEDWIPVDKDMPVEYDSVFTRFHGTDKWRDGMWLKSSARVLVTVEFEDGTRRTETAKTTDGKWVTENRIIKRKVVAWKEMPKEYKGK